MAPIYDGLMHFLMSPEGFVPVLVFVFLAGLRGAAAGRRALFVLPVAWLLGRLAGLIAVAANPHPFIAAGWFLLRGGLLDADAKLSLHVTTALAAFLGLCHGYLKGTGMDLFETAAVSLLGLMFAVFVLVALAAAFVVCLRAKWARIAVRCRKLDRRQRPAHARVGRPGTLAEAPGASMRIHLMTAPEMRYCPKGFVRDECSRP